MHRYIYNIFSSYSVYFGSVRKISKVYILLYNYSISTIFKFDASFWATFFNIFVFDFVCRSSKDNHLNAVFINSN